MRWETWTAASHHHLLLASLTFYLAQSSEQKMHEQCIWRKGMKSSTFIVGVFFIYLETPIICSGHQMKDKVKLRCKNQDSHRCQHITLFLLIHNKIIWNDCIWESGIANCLCFLLNVVKNLYQINIPFFH